MKGPVSGSRRQKISNPSEGKGVFFSINTTLLPLIREFEKLVHPQEHIKGLNSHYLEEDNKHLKHVSSTFEATKTLLD